MNKALKLIEEIKQLLLFRDDEKQYHNWESFIRKIGSFEDRTNIFLMKMLRRWSSVSKLDPDAIALYCYSLSMSSHLTKLELQDVNRLWKNMISSEISRGYNRLKELHESGFYEGDIPEVHDEDIPRTPEQLAQILNDMAYGSDDFMRQFQINRVPPNALDAIHRDAAKCMIDTGLVPYPKTRAWRSTVNSEFQLRFNWLYRNMDLHKELEPIVNQLMKEYNKFR